MEMNIWIELGILAIIFIVGGAIKLWTRWLVKQVDGSLGLVKKKAAKGKVVAKD